MTSLLQIVAALLASSFLSLHGLKKGSLNNSGAIAAFLTGFIHFTSPFYLVPIALIAFYLAGSRVTHFKEAEKAKIEGETIKDTKGRTAYQVFCNSIVATLLILYMRRNEMNHCPESRNLTDVALKMIIAHYAIVAGDTFSSELGILSQGNPRLILPPWNHVPRGTNGGVSLFGFLAAILGGGLIGIVSYVAWGLQCGKSVWVSPHIIVYGAVCGFLGSILDSILGATLQASYVDASGKIVSKNPGNTLQKASPGLDLLSNNAVNLTTALIGTLFSGYEILLGHLEK